MSSIERKLKRAKRRTVKGPSYFLTKVGKLNQQVAIERMYIQSMLKQQAEQREIPQRKGR